jgi:hypothetical protein
MRPSLFCPLLQTFVSGLVKGVRGVDIARGELVEKELDAMIERRSRQKDPDEESELWKGSVAAYEEKRRHTARLEWHLYHTAQAERMRRHHEATGEIPPERGFFGWWRRLVRGRQAELRGGRGKL